MTRYQISIGALHLPKHFFRKPSPYCTVKITEGPHGSTEIGRTQVLKECTDPDWTDTLYVDTDLSVRTPIIVELWDHHGKSHKQDRKIGEAEFEVMEIYQTDGHMQTEALLGGGQVDVTVLESLRGNTMGRINLQLRGLDIRNVEPGLLGLGRSDPFFEIAKKNADPASGVVRWVTVYRSEFILNHLNPFWDEFSMTTEDLCFCDPNALIRIAVKDYQKSGKHRLIGLVETTMKSLMERVAVRGNADRQNALDLCRESGRHTGLIVVLKASLV
jgi:Ca2+-dependent lipid-binding protein